MRWATFHGEDDSALRVGVVQGDKIYAAPSGTSLIDCFGDSPEEFVRTGRALVAGSDAVLAFDEVRLAAPVPTPPSVRDFMVFEEHVAGSSRARGGEIDPDWYELPVFYFSNPAAVRGDSDTIRVAPGSLRFDYEIELGAVIGWRGAHVGPDTAGDLIAGYLLFIDWSARDLQAREMRQRLGPAKGKDTATTLGPVLVTPDELEPHRDGRGFALNVGAHVNDRSYSSGSFAAMHWSMEEAIAYAARGTEVRPGDVIGSGTCGGGCIAELQTAHGAQRYPWLRAGDTITITADVLGTVRNTLVDALPLHPARHS